MARRENEKAQLQREAAEQAAAAIAALEAAAAAAAEEAAREEKQVEASAGAGADADADAFQHPVPSPADRKKLVSEMTAQERMMQKDAWKLQAGTREHREHKARRHAEKKKAKAQQRGEDADGNRGEADSQPHGHSHDSDEHWQRPDKKERLDRKKTIHKHAEIYRNEKGEVIDGPPRAAPASATVAEDGGWDHSDEDAQ